MIVLGGLLALWGALVLYFAPRLHAGWRDMLRGMRASGVRNTLPLTDWIASGRGLVGMRRAGAVALVAGLALSAAGAIRLALG
jgi:hypothetical protein